MLSDVVIIYIPTFPKQPVFYGHYSVRDILFFNV
jgi:hypothetical protein